MDEYTQVLLYWANEQAQHLEIYFEILASTIFEKMHAFIKQLDNAVRKISENVQQIQRYII